MEPFEILLFLGFCVIVVVLFQVKEERLQDPERLDTVFIHQMKEVCRLPQGPVVATLVRQSGHLYRELGEFEPVAAAMVEIEKSFRRANFESVYVQDNSETRFRVIRLHHSYGGKANGKKLGGALIQAV